MSAHAVYAAPGTHQKDGFRPLISMCNLDLDGGINFMKRTGWTSVYVSQQWKKKYI